MLSLVRVCFGALLRRHPRPAPSLRGADRGSLRRSFPRGRRRGSGGLRVVAPQGRRFSRPSGGAVMALRRSPPAGEQSPSGDAQSRGAGAWVGPGRRSRHGPSRRCAQHPRTSRTRSGPSGSRGDVGVFDGAARGQGAGRGRGGARAQRQHHALACAARPRASAAGAHRCAGAAGHGLGVDGDHVRSRIGRGGGAA